MTFTIKGIRIFAKYQNEKDLPKDKTVKSRTKIMKVLIIIALLATGAYALPAKSYLREGDMLFQTVSYFFCSELEPNKVVEKSETWLMFFYRHHISKITNQKFDFN